MPPTDLRLEPIPGSDHLSDGLAARIHDPLWLLTRQWQFGEFEADDAASPAWVDIGVVTAPVAAWRPGAGDWLPYKPGDAPLDVLIESTAGLPRERTRIELGAQFVRLLRTNGLEEHIKEVVARFGFPDDSFTTVDPVLAALASAVPDPERLAPALEAFQAGGASPLPIPAGHAATLRQLGGKWLAMNRAAATTASSARAAWNHERLEYQLEIAASAAGGVVLRAEEYHGQGLDWALFDIAADAAPPPFDLPPPERQAPLRGIPAAVQFGGIPASRFWELEDARFNFGNIDAGPQDLGRLLLVQFATVFGNDWFLVPMRLPSGHLVDLEYVVVTDVFGGRSVITRAGRDDPNWNLFSLAPPRGTTHAAQDLLLLPPGLDTYLEGSPIEAIELIRDELANLAWAVERRVQTDLETVIDRREVWMRRRAGMAPEIPESLPAYIVSTEVPDYWLPLVPEQLGDRRSYRFVLVPLTPLSAGETVQDPKGVLLRATSEAERRWIQEEEVPRSGVTVERVCRYARWYGGTIHQWVATRKRHGRGEGSSGLRFDAVVEPRPKP